MQASGAGRITDIASNAACWTRGALPFAMIVVLVEEGNVYPETNSRYLWYLWRDDRAVQKPKRVRQCRAQKQTDGVDARGRRAKCYL